MSTGIWGWCHNFVNDAKRVSMLIEERKKTPIVKGPPSKIHSLVFDVIFPVFKCVTVALSSTSLSIPWYYDWFVMFDGSYVVN